MFSTSHNIEPRSMATFLATRYTEEKQTLYHEDVCSNNAGLLKRGRRKMPTLPSLNVEMTQLSLTSDEPMSCMVAKQPCDYLSAVTPQLYIGSERVARNKELLKKNGITHIVNCAGTCHFVPEEYC